MAGSSPLLQPRPAAATAAAVAGGLAHWDLRVVMPFARVEPGHEHRLHRRAQVAPKQPVDVGASTSWSWRAGPAGTGRLPDNG